MGNLRGRLLARGGYASVDAGTAIPRSRGFGRTHHKDRGHNAALRSPGATDCTAAAATADTAETADTAGTADTAAAAEPSVAGFSDCAGPTP